VCKSLDCVEDEQHFVFDCPAYSHIRSQHLDLLQHCCTIADFIILCEPNACGGFLRECFACRKQILSVWIHWIELLVCWVPVAPQDIKYIDWLIDESRKSGGNVLANSTGMHFDAPRSLTQPCLIAYCDTICLWSRHFVRLCNVYLRSNLSRT